MRTDFDVAVIGLGTMGSMGLWQLAEDGLDVAGFEQFGIGHDRGAVGGETRLFRRMQPGRPAFTPVIDVARAQWQSLQEHSSVQLLTQTGGVTIGSPRDSRMVEHRESAEDTGLSVEILDQAEMAVRFPEHRLDSGEIGMFDPTRGYIRCEQSVLTAIQRAKCLGAQVHDYTKVTVDHASQDGVVLTDGQREWTAKNVVITTGAWSGEHLPVNLREKSRARRIRLTWFSPKPGHNFSADSFPVFDRLVDDGALYGAPSLDGGGSVKVAPGAAPSQIIGPDDYFRGQSLEEIHYMERHVAKYLPGLEQSPIRASAWIDYYADDWLPFVGKLPGTENVVLANGFAGFGFKMSPGIGRITADIVQGKIERNFEFMSPSRTISDSTGGA